jgi:hypothetical protein
MPQRGKTQGGQLELQRAEVVPAQYDIVEQVAGALAASERPAGSGIRFEHLPLDRQHLGTNRCQLPLQPRQRIGPFRR